MLWFFLGGFGAHRFYLGRTGSAVGMLLLTIFGVLTAYFLIGIALLLAVGIWWILDAFLIPGIVTKQVEERRALIAAEIALTTQA